MSSETPKSPKPPIDPWLLPLLACPCCPTRPALALNAAQDALLCNECKQQFPIRDGVPMLRPEDATPQP